MDKTIPEQLDWVNARAECSLVSQFALLRADATRDVERRNALFKIAPARVFAVDTDNEKRFHIGLQDAPNRLDGGLAISFELHEGRIAVIKFVAGSKETALFDIRVGLDEFGKCMLYVEDKPLYRWQVLKKALEDLFFPGRPERRDRE